MSQELLNIFLTALGIAVTGLVSWAVAALTTFINSKMKDQKMAKLLTKCLDIIANAVKKIFQEFVEALKKEGKFDKEAQNQAKEAAMKIINSELTPELIEFIQANFGDVQEWISNQIEVAIYNLKNK